MARRSAVTLKELAQALELSPSTVSRVLNDPSGIDSRWASPETNQKIYDLATELGYVKNQYAASLRTAKSLLIGVVVPRLQDYVLATMYEGIDEAALEHGYAAVVANSLDQPATHDLRVRKFLDRRIDGLILGDTPFDGATLKSLDKEKVPFVLVNRRSPGHLSVTCNDQMGGRLVGEHFAEFGSKKIFLLAGDHRMSTSIDRTTGFIEALAEQGIHLPVSHIAYGGFDTSSGEKATRDLLDAHGIPEAIFAVNDFAAIGALGVLRERGLKVPEDVKVVGYNDTPLASGVGLTSVHSPMHEIGRRGFDLLLKNIQGEECESVQLDTNLVIRSTSR
ncbi:MULTISPECIES: LacI family DNA-binding transcriptional regulator [Micrococcaceae]|uniref:LacI family DNA-binding transcriptional regulator n=1 Tax=Glutamicibacter mishrai TaxID=1775880 RepID=A0A6H0SJY5_9MICC|nr:MULTISPECIES: LacI family DNA-binding transcriptional regulator [Micrococcaceae]KSU66005.1 LacI family transcriptional regulator [Arthrobacter sp. NIO-1057]QIV86861.1 LacI family DNA-binding transcriptional regulator [Glutamicibacter mishrai]SCC29679.1 transcriptional regulator, LacI family [Arthrobacter sp. NIO-1057]